MEYFIYLTLFGMAALCIGWIKVLCQKISISYSIIFFLLGVLVYMLIPDLPWTHPFRDQEFTKHLTELMVIVALMGIGLKIDRPIRSKLWRMPLLLASAAMVVSIIMISLYGHYLLGFGLASALLLGAVLAPTDPVLASDVQVGSPGEEKAHKVKFVLTGEAGLNDGLAFPFTWLAIAVALNAGVNNALVTEWFFFDVLYRIVAGLITGFAGGKLVTWLFFKLPEHFDFQHLQRGLVALSATLFIYGVTELVQGYGFIAVFIAAVTIRNYEMEHKYHKTLHDFIDQIEHILLAILLILLGGAVVDGLLETIRLEHIIAACVFIFVVRPLASLLSLINSPMILKHKLLVSFYGIKGVGSFFYLAFALNEVAFERAEELWAITALVVIFSLFIHGLTSTFAMRELEHEKD